MKKTLLVLVVLLMIIPSVFAGGNNESVSTTEWGAISKFVYYFSSVFDYATSEICVAVTPFPSVLNAFTDMSTKETAFTETGVLVNRRLSEISDSEYLLTSPNRVSFQNSELGNIFSMGSDGKLLRSKDDENKIWGMISYLFAIFTVLEVLYVTIRGYLVDEDNLVRKVVTRLLVTGILFLVLMALPALVELFRIGFFQMAEIVSTPFAFSELVEAKSVFELPGGVLRCTSKILENMTPDSLGWNLESKLKDGVLSSGFGDWVRNGIFKILYFCLDVYVMVMSLLSAFQIMMNIVEVYILLAIVMCLVPFQVFTGTRYLVGENLIKSLFSNVIELFVIMIIIGASANAAYTISEFGMIYLTNPDYYPVVITLDTSKLGESFSQAKFAASTDPNKGLSLLFSTTYKGGRDSSGYIIPSEEKGQSEIMSEMMQKLRSQYYGNISGEDVNSIEKYMLPLKTYANQYLAPFSIPPDEIYSEVSPSNVDANAMVTLFNGIVKNDGLGLSDVSSSGSSSNVVLQIFPGFLRKIQENLAADNDSGSFWPGSIQAYISFDSNNPVWLDSYFDENRLKELVTLKVPAKTVKITFAGLLGNSVKNSYGGNKAIDNALEEFLDTITNVAYDGKTWSDLSYFQKTSLLSLISEALGNTITFAHDSQFLSSANLETEAAKPTWGLLLQHFFVCILAAFMQLYFIKKSSTITNALQSGNVSMDRTQALERRVMAAAGFAAAAPVKAATGLIGAGSGSLINHAKDDRTAPLNDAR